MKRAGLFAAAGLTLALVLSACGGGTTTPGTGTGGTGTTTPPTPDLSKVYNPAASLSQTAGGRVAYKGDWVMVAKLADNTYRYGVNSISLDASSANLINAGGGVSGWCRTTDCTSNEETGTLIAGSINVSGKAQLVVGMVPRNQQVTRFVMADDDGIVDNINGNPVIAGAGVWTENGQDQDAFFSFIQTSDVASVKAASVQASGLSSVQRSAVAVLSLPRAAKTFDSATVSRVLLQATRWTHPNR